MVAEQQNHKEVIMTKEVLKTMLQDIINDRQEQAAVTMHDYFVAKTREVAGLGDSTPAVEQEPELDETE